MTLVNPAYLGREQTLVKHTVLRQYLTALALIVGRTFARDIVFVDCCSGPWETVTDDLSDSSVGIAIQQLRLARDMLNGEGRSVTFRCLFAEEKPSTFAQLKKFCDAVTDIEVEALPGDFTQHIPAIQRFVARRNKSFPFFFIDPTGWTPLQINPLTPLLRTDPGEVLINFMTSHIRRFLSAEGKDFDALLGQQPLDEIQKLSGQERDDAALFTYAGHVRQRGNFPYVCTTVVLNPERNESHFHLIYATRHHKGVEVFKQAERKAREVMTMARAEIKERKRIDCTQQRELFTVEEHGAAPDRQLVALCDRYQGRAKELVQEHLVRNRLRRVPYETVWQIACLFPLVWETDLRRWIREWKGNVTIVGMEPKQRVPKCDAGNVLIWNDQSQ